MKSTPVTEKLANESGRRALLVFSDGEDNSSSHDMMTAIEAAQSANVLIFTIRYTEKKHGKLTARNKYGIRVMDRVAKETGGQHIDAETTDPKTYFRQIAEELRSSYELAYYPSNPIRDDTFRKDRDPTETGRLNGTLPNGILLTIRRLIPRTCSAIRARAIRAFLLLVSEVTDTNQRALIQQAGVVGEIRRGARKYQSFLDQPNSVGLTLWRNRNRNRMLSRSGCII